jgi:hypothetical protein
VTDAPDEKIETLEAESESPDSQDSRLQSLFSQRGPLIVAIAAAIGGLALLCLFAYLLLNSDSPEEPDVTPLVEEVLEEEVDTDTYEYQAISESGTISVTLETPIFLNLAGEQYSVQAEVLPESGPWTPEAPYETTALWVYGSVINYVFGLDDTDENRALLNSLSVDDQIILTTRSGVSSNFAVSSRQNIDAEERAVFAQRAPGVTLVLVEEDLEAERMVVRGRYTTTDAGAISPEAGRVVEMGETAQLDSLQITVSGVAHLVDRPEAAEGFAFFMIDYQVQNVGGTSVQASSLTMVLADDLGNLYALNPAASPLGNHPSLNGSIAPGLPVVATTGYQIPISLSSANLHWQVSISGTSSQIQVNIPFQETTSAEQQVRITVQSATVSPDGGSLLIVGLINNESSQPLVVDINNVSLTTTTGTVFQMLSTNPAFPWTIPPGQTLQYGVTFQRPLSGEAIFTILNQSFNLTGLQ